MRRVEVQESQKAPLDYPSEAVIYREAYGVQLAELCGRLATWSAQKYGSAAKVYRPLPSDPALRARADYSPTRVEIIRAKEMANNPGLIDQLADLGEGLNEKLRQQIPSLGSSPDEDPVVRAVDIHDNKGVHYLCLLFDEETGVTIGEERSHIWDELEKITGAQDLVRRETPPELMLARFKPDTISATEARALEKLVQEKALPITVKLRPVHLPNWSEFRSSELD